MNVSEFINKADQAFNSLKPLKFIKISQVPARNVSHAL